MHEFFDDLLTPRAERTPAETAPESLHPGESDALNLGRIAVEYGHARVREHLFDLALFAGLEIVIAEDADGRNAEVCGDVLGEDLRLFDIPVVGQIAAHQQYIGDLGDLREQRLQRTLRRFLDVKVSDCSDAQCVFVRHYRYPS